MEINIIKVNPNSIYEFNTKTGLPKNKLAKNFVKELDEKVGNKDYIIIFEQPDIGITNKVISFDTIIINK
jgi:hypothetical protein